MKRAFVFIDGNNFYFKLKELKSKLNCNYNLLDTDLVAAVEEVQSIGKGVYYIGIPKGQSFGLSKTANDVRLLRSEEIKQFFPEVLLK